MKRKYLPYFYLYSNGDLQLSKSYENILVAYLVREIFENENLTGGTIFYTVELLQVFFHVDGSDYKFDEVIIKYCIRSSNFIS